MNLKVFGLALAAGVATFIVAGVAVTEIQVESLALQGGDEADNY